MKKTPTWQQLPEKKVYEPNQTFLHIDFPLLFSVLLLTCFGLFILYSASNQNILVIRAQLTRILLGFIVMLCVAHISPHRLKSLAVSLYVLALLLLVTVLIVGHIGKGAQRWLDLGFFRFQPSDIMKLALPMMLASYLSDKTLPPSSRDILIVAGLTLLPALLIAKQPDLGTAVLVFFAGFVVLLLVGIRWRFVASLVCLGVFCMPVLWYFMRDYQRQRVLTFLNPERDPLGSGYHIIQSKIAIGSGGLFGKGWLNGTQSHLAFLPEHATDFIYAVCGEELGLIGGLLLITLYVAITARCLSIALHAQDSFSRLLASCLAIMFIFSAFVNIGMVSGILPVVGLPLPLVSYGGTSVVILFATFGVLMSIQTHRKLVAC